MIDWDVTNETVNNRVLMDFLGREEMVRWYHLARQADPHAKLYINDYAMLSGGAVDQKRIDRFYDEIKYLIDHGAPLDGIGEQAHFGWQLVGIPRMLQLLDRFAGLGLPIKITEFDVAVKDEKLQAEFTRDFYTAAFSHPNVEAILMWGFWEGSHWMPSAAMFRKDWTAKPNYHAYHDLVFRDWWTNLDGVTNARGLFQGRGFLGEYEVQVERGGQSVTQRFSLERSGSRMTIQLPAP